MKKFTPILFFLLLFGSLLSAQTEHATSEQFKTPDDTNSSLFSLLNIENIDGIRHTDDGGARGCPGGSISGITTDNDPLIVDFLGNGGATPFFVDVHEVTINSSDPFDLSPDFNTLFEGAPSEDGSSVILIYSEPFCPDNNTPFLTYPGYIGGAAYFDNDPNPVFVDSDFPLNPVNLEPGTYYFVLASNDFGLEYSIWYNIFFCSSTPNHFSFTDVTDDPCNPCSHDTEKPTISCSGLNTDVYIEPGDCGVYVELSVPDAEDNCEIASLDWRYRTVDEDNNNIGPWSGWESEDFAYVYLQEGRYKIQWRAKDALNNAKKCRYFIDVMDADDLPCPWAENHVDCDSSAAYDEEADSYEISSYGCSNAITNTADQLAFVQQTICGNGEITVEVSGISGTGNGWAGVCMRESGAAGAKMVAASTNRSSSHKYEARTTTNGNVTAQLRPAFNRHWLRLKRVGNSFRIYASSNGSSWFLRRSLSVSMDECLEVGMIVNSYVGSGENTATFENVSISGDNNDLQETPEVTNNYATTRSFNVFPNPSNGQFNIYFEKVIDQEGTIDIINVDGKVVYSANSYFEGGINLEINIENQPNGMYLVRLKLDDGTEEVQRVVLQK